MRAFRSFISSVVGAALIVLVLRSFAFATYSIPSESMVPTLEVGDRVVALKFPWGFSRFSFPGGESLPPLGGAEGRVIGAVPARGDVAVFRHPRAEMDMIKRVIGLPGDRVAIRQGRVWLNGAPLPLDQANPYVYRDTQGDVAAVTAYRETLPGGRAHTIILRDRRFGGTDMAETTVPEGRLFMLGDNRDNSDDSRFSRMGFVPMENLIGRADAILYSFAGCEEREPGLRCPPRRHLTPIDR